MSEGKGPTRDAQAESEKVTTPQGAECSPPEEPTGRRGTETGELPPVTLRAAAVIWRSRQLPGEPEERWQQGIQVPPQIAPRQTPQPARPQRAASAILRIATVLAAIVLLAIGEGLWDAPTGDAAVAEQRENLAVAKPWASTGAALPLKASLDEMEAPASDPLPALSSVLLVAQDESPGAPPQPSAGAKASSPPESQEENPAPVAPASPPHPRAASRSALNERLSSDLSQYLHQNHLPFVDALVFGNAAGRPTSVKLSGQVRTEHGKEDAEIKARDFLNEAGLRIQNHVEVNASLASNPPASSSAPAESPPTTGAATAAADPCTDLCFKDEGHCNSSCQTQAAGGATSGGFSAQAILGQFGQSATALKQCNDQCVQTREHCTYECQAASSAPPSEGADSGGPQPDAADHQSEGPDTPPE